MMNKNIKETLFSLKVPTVFALAFVVAQGAMAAGFPGSPVEVEAVVEKTMAPLTWVAGVVVGRDDAEVAAEVEGRVTFVAEEGVRLSAGDVMARLDDTLLKIALTEAEAEMASEQAALGFLNQEVERLQRLAQSNNAARNQLDETTSEREAAISGLAAAEARLFLARERLALAEIRAPFSGVVVNRLKRKGEWVNSGEALIHLLSNQRLEVEARAPIKLMAYLTPGQTVTVKSGGIELDARLRVLVPAGEGPSRLMRLKLAMAQSPWHVGQSVRVALPSAIARRVLAVHQDALVLRSRGVSVFRINADNNAEQVAVTTGVAVGNYIEVQGELKQGDRVVIRGGERLRAGQNVRLVGGMAAASPQSETGDKPASGNPWWPGGDKKADETKGDSNPWWPGDKQKDSGGE